MVCGKVTENRLNGDQKAELALLTMIFKFLGNSAYAKVIKALERQTTKKYTKSESVLRKKLHSVSFNNLVEIGDEYKIETWKHKVDIYWPFQVGIAVYLFAKLRVLQFHYDCLDKFVGLIQIPFVFRFIVWFFGRGGAPRAVGQVLHVQNRMFLLEQMEQARAWLV